MKHKPNPKNILFINLKQIMYYLPPCLVLFFLFSLLHLLPYASSTQEGWCESKFQCGKITAGFPFSGGNRPQVCGHPSLELNCYNETTSLIISNHFYKVLHIDQTSNTLKLARAELQGSFCNATFTATPTFPSDIFELSPTYKSLTVFYLCDPKLSYRSSYTCPGRGPVIISQNLDYHESCKDSFTISVPKSFVPEEEELNLTRLKNALREGFELKMKIDKKACQGCLSSHGSCRFQNTTQVCCLRSSSPRCASINNSAIDAGLSNATLSNEGLSNAGLSAAVKSGIGIASVLGILFITGALLLLIRRRRKTQSSQYWKQQNLEALISLKRYSYTQVKRITNSFAEVIGKGGFGIVYRGTLCDGRSVAVKILKDSKGSGEDFINEVASMSKTSHVNIVDLLGYCSEGSKRAILYEFMENGSLDRYIPKKTLDWTKLYTIALGIARGLEYLHHGCKEKIVHFDIKPQNILLDAELCPKVSDFGLAKLCKKKESILSLLDTRGTIGYIAPEVFSKMYGRVSHKSDVYSYGMLVLEMIGARNKERAAENSGSNTSSMYFPEWIYKDLENGSIGDGIICEEDELVKKMTLVGLWCIQSSPSDRPPMNRVVEMMESSVDSIETPPRPCVQIPAASFQLSSTLSEDISISSENS